jgi:hypothetical protein
MMVSTYLSHEEYAFVERRSIMDNDLIAIEVIHALKRVEGDARVEWRILQKLDSLVAIILKARYFLLTYFLEADIGHNP